MAKFKRLVTVDVESYFTAKVKGAIVDADLGKPVKLSVDATDTYELCATGDQIDGFLVALAPATADGLVLATINGAGLVSVQVDGTPDVGDFVASGVPAAIGTAETSNLGKVIPYTLLATSHAKWRIVSATTTDGSILSGDTNVVIERV